MFKKIAKHNRMDGCGQKRCKEILGEKLIQARHKWLQEKWKDPQDYREIKQNQDVWIENKLTVFEKKTRRRTGKSERRDHQNQ